VRAYSVALLALMVFLSFLMISTLRYSSFKGVGTRNYHPRVLILGIALVVTAIWFYSQWSLLIITTVYVAHGIVGKFWSLIKSHKVIAADHQDLELESKPQS